MKRIYILVFLILFALPCYAHPGRTDEYGGHNSPNGYHYHHGYPAHLHTDGICPYDYDDKTGSSSGSSSAKTYQKSEKSDKENYEQAYQAGYTAASEKYGLYLFFLCAPFLFYLVYRSFRHRTISVCTKQIHELSENISSLRDEKTNLQSTLSTLNKDINHTQEKLKNIEAEYAKQCEMLLAVPVPIPKGIVIGKDNLPADANAPLHWGSTFTVYLNKHTHIYHKGYCRHVNKNNCIPTHILTANKFHSPCKLCTPKMPDLEWYQIYLAKQKFEKIRLSKK